MTAKINIAVLATFTLIILFFIFAISKNRRVDTYWHLAVGRQVWQDKRIPTSDKFTYGSANTNYTSTEWLSGLIFYLAVKYFGEESLVIIRTITTVGAIFFLYKTLRLFMKDSSRPLAAILICAYILALRANDRPEVISFIFLAFVNYCCLHFYLKKTLPHAFYFLPAIFLIWPNIHASCILGAVLPIFWLAYFLIFKAGISQLDLKKFTLVTLASIALSIVQFKRFFYPIIASQKIIPYTNEWNSTFQRLKATDGIRFVSQIPPEFYFYLAYVLFFIFLIVKFSKSKLDISKILILLFNLSLLTLPVFYFRLIPPIILITTPALFWAAGTMLANNSIYKTLAKAAFVILSVVIIGSVFTRDIVGQKITAFAITNLNDQNKIVQVVNYNWNTLLPQPAPEIIRKYLNSERVFTLRYWNDFVVWQVESTQTFSDAMSEYRDSESFENEKILASGIENWRKLLERYDVDTVINPQDLPYIQAKTPVYTINNWKLVYVDSVFALYAREDVIKSVPVDLSAIQPELNSPLKFKPENETAAVAQLQKLMLYDEKNAFARDQLVKYYIQKDLSQAQKLAEESRKLLPKDPAFSVDLAAIYAKQNNCQQAREFAREAITKSFNHVIIKDQLNQNLQNCNLFYK